jgi:hypothetical protein
VLLASLHFSLLECTEFHYVSELSLLEVLALTTDHSLDDSLEQAVSSHQ